MKKTLVILAALVLSVPAWASVNITCSDEGNGVIGIYYNNTETHNVRAFALNITVDGDTVITGASDFNPAYAVAPGSYVSQTNLGNPVCDATKYPGTLSGLGTNGITIEMASLYAPGQPAPPKSGLLCKLQLTGTGTTTISIAANTIRRGPLVMENPDETPSVILSSCVTICCDYHCDGCIGDIDQDSYVSLYDFDILTTILLNYPPDYYCEFGTFGCDAYCGDMDQDGYLSLYDFDILVTELLKYWPDYYYECSW